MADGGDAEAESDEPDASPFPPGGPFDRFFKRFGLPNAGDGEHRRMHPTMAQGSGFFISADG